MEHATAPQTCDRPLHVFRPPMTLWHQMLLRSANDNTLPWPKRLGMIGLWVTVIGMIGWCTFYL